MPISTGGSRGGGGPRGGPTYDSRLAKKINLIYNETIIYVFKKLLRGPPPPGSASVLRIYLTDTSAGVQDPGSCHFHFTSAAMPETPTDFNVLQSKLIFIFTHNVTKYVRN